MVKFPTYSLLIVFLVFLMPSLSGQPENSYPFKNFSNREGFDQNTVWSIEQDKNGIYWLGTANGLIKYDGYSFYDVSWDLEYQADIYGERIGDILNDEQGLLWILSSNGLSIFNPAIERFFKISSDSIPQLSGVMEEENGTVLVFGRGFISSVTAGIMGDSITADWSHNLVPQEHSELRINDVLKVNEELYLLATSQGVYKMMISGDPAGPLFKSDALIADQRVSCLLRQDDLIWVGTSGGLHKTVIDGGKLRYLNSYSHSTSDPLTIGSNDIRTLLTGEDNNLWIGTWGGGLSLFESQDEVFYNFFFDPRNKDGISSSLINCIYRDQFNVLWIGTSQGGMSKLDLSRKPFTNFEHNPYENSSIPGNLINCILEDSEGYLWISTYQNPLSRSIKPVNDKSINNMSFKRYESWFNSFHGKNILSIYEDKHGYIWLGYENAVVLFDRKNESFTEISFEVHGVPIPAGQVNYNFIGSINKDKIIIAGNRILVIDNPWRHIRPYTRISIPVFATSTLLGSPVITAGIEGPEKIWIALRNQGLSQYSLVGDSLVLHDRLMSSREVNNSISSNSIFSIHKDRHERLWIGTFGGGLNRMNDDPTAGVSFDRLRDTLDLRDNVIYGIIEQNDSTLWLSTDLGICKLNSRNLQTLRFNIADGVASNNFRKNAYYKGHSGFYYFGGLYGLTVFKPDQINPNLIAPEILLSELEINNENVKPGEQINKKFTLAKPVSDISRLILTRSNQTLAFEVIVMHTATPEKNSFSYMLEGFDEKWIDVDQGSYKLSYNNLPSGKYNLRIRAFNGDGIISENETSLEIIMLSPWYAQIWSILLFIFVGLSIFFGIARYIIKIKDLQNSLHYEKIDKERIIEVNKAKLRFFTNISHEFKTPLALISIPLQKLHELITDKELKKHVSAAEKNTNKLISLIDQLMTFRRIEHGKLELKLNRTTLDEFLSPIAEAFESLSIKKKIEFYYESAEPELKIGIDLEKMEQVIYNLLSNAFKFTSPGGRVTLEGKSYPIDNSPHVCIEIKDTGKGIPKKDLDMIFERFYQGDTEVKNLGTGIGLTFSKSIIELHKGFIHVDSTPGAGSVFSVILPVNKDFLTHTDEDEVRRMDSYELIEFEELAGSLGTERLDSIQNSGTIHITDDEEEFTIAIREIFKSNYRILEASNGRDALNIAREEDLDLIISDVMMPEMNGYDFCSQVKSDIDLCHIPFILLTALDEMENHIQGVEYGADSYISKPFNLKYLEISAQKLIENRKKILEHFSRTHSIPKNVKISGIDREFIESINKTIQENLDNSSFGVVDLAESLNLSTSHFYRKLKLLTGQIPNAYIRNFRLRAAADLLKANPGISVKDVMYEVGFESASHFSHAFKKKYGLSPSEYTN